jgi:nucleoid DNA-binding protein
VRAVSVRRATVVPSIALLAGAWALAGDPLLHSVAAQIVVAGGFVGCLMVVGLRRSREARGTWDPFHPLVFPLAYVAVSFLAPIWLDEVMHRPLRGLGRAIPIAPGAAKLLIVGVVGFAAGAAIRHRRKEPEPRADQKPVAPWRLLAFGRVLLLLPLAISANRFVAGSVHSRGVGHLAANDVLSALLDPTEIAAVVLILAAHRMAKHDRLLARLDWCLIGGLVLLIGARGSRGNAIALMLALAVVATSHRAKVAAVVIAAVAIVSFGVLDLHYRSAAVGRDITASSTDILLGDMTVAAFTTGATAAAVPKEVPYSHGRTLLAALERQLPSPVANRLFGPPTDTAAHEFREIIGFDNPNAGVGYSIPAEGYLNFGRLGVFMLCGLLGMGFAWAYSRFTSSGEKVSGLMYPVVVAALPFGLRSDSLGLIKTILYAALLMQVAVVVARVPRGLGADLSDRTLASRLAIARARHLGVPAGRPLAEPVHQARTVRGSAGQDQIDGLLARRRRPRHGFG